MKLIRIAYFLAIATLPGLVACGSKPVSMVAAPPTTNAEPSRDTSGIAVSAEVGALNEDAVDRVFEKAQSGLMECVSKGASRVELLGGDIAIFVGINANGRAEDARLEHSTLGDRDTEACMLQVLRGRTWPKPVGGRKGQARKSISFDMPNDARPPVQWSVDDVEDTVKKLHKRVEECTGGGSGTYQVTAYIDTRGSAISVGIAPPDNVGESKADCLVAVIKRAKFKSPGSYPAKVSFEL
jgi:hypothetical protein